MIYMVLGNLYLTISRGCRYFICIKFTYLDNDLILKER
nr:MAG TPA: hypothetical protein [Caudoviricetes sp.]